MTRRNPSTTLTGVGAAAAQPSSGSPAGQMFVARSARNSAFLSAASAIRRRVNRQNQTKSRAAGAHGVCRK